ncbi:UBP1-associated protein 2C, partial [Linum grandiflorum]
VTKIFPQIGDFYPILTATGLGFVCINKGSKAKKIQSISQSGCFVRMVDNNIIRFPDLSCFTEHAFRTAFSIAGEPNSPSPDRASSLSMEEMKKRKMDEAINGGEAPNQDLLRSLLEPLSKSQLIDLLSGLGTQYPSIAEEIKSLASADPVHRKLFVRGLAWTTTSDTLFAAFQMHGEIEEGAVIHDKVTGKSRGYGFITFKHMESAQSALKAPSKLIDGRLAVCNLACEGLSGATSTPDLAQRKLYIGGLSPDITSEALLKYFGRHGEIEEGSVAYDKDTNESRSRIQWIWLCHIQDTGGCKESLG